MSPSSSTQLEELRRRVRGWRAAEQRERLVRARRPPLPPREALDAAIELHELYGMFAVAGSDDLRERQVQDVRAAWRTLRTRLGGASPR